MEVEHRVLALCSVLCARESLPIHIPFENTMQPSAEALQIGGEMRGEGEREVREKWHNGTVANNCH